MQALGTIALKSGASFTVMLQDGNTPNNGAVLSNQSPLPLVISVNGSTANLPPWTSDFYPFPSSTTSLSVVVGSGSGSGSLLPTLFNINDAAPAGYPNGNPNTVVNLGSGSSVDITSGTVNVNPGTSPLYVQGDQNLIFQGELALKASPFAITVPAGTRSLVLVNNQNGFGGVSASAPIFYDMKISGQSSQIVYYSSSNVGGGYIVCPFYAGIDTTVLLTYNTAPLAPGVTNVLALPDEYLQGVSSKSPYFTLDAGPFPTSSGQTAVASTANVYVPLIPAPPTNTAGYKIKLLTFSNIPVSGTAYIMGQTSGNLYYQGDLGKPAAGTTGPAYGIGPVTLDLLATEQLNFSSSVVPLRCTAACELVPIPH